MKNKLRKKLMNNWRYINTRKLDWAQFVHQYVPQHLTKPAVGKIALYLNHISLFDDIVYNGDGYAMIINISKNEISLIENENIRAIPLTNIKKNWLFSNVTTKLKDKSFAITGLTTLPRITYQNLIELNGGIYHETVNQHTNYLINVAPIETNKLKKAKHLKIRLINEIQFFKMIS